MIDAIRYLRQLQMTICDLRPLLTHFDHGTRCFLIQLACFFADAIAINHPCRRQNVRMVIALIAIAVRRVDRGIGGDAETINKPSAELVDARLLLLPVKLRRQRNFIFSRRHTVLSCFRRLGAVPQRIAFG